VIGGAQGITLAIGDALQSAIAAIGAAPLDPASYASALGALAIGGFGVVNAVTATAGGLAQVPLTVIGNLNSTFAGVLTDLSTQIGASLSNILVAVGLPQEISDLPIQAAANLNTVIAGLSTAVADGLEFTSGLITEGVNLAFDVSNGAQTAVLDVLGNPEIPAPPIPVPPAPLEVEDNDVVVTTFSEGEGGSGDLERNGPVDEATPGMLTVTPAESDSAGTEEGSDDGTVGAPDTGDASSDQQTGDTGDETGNGSADTGRSTESKKPTDTDDSTDAHSSTDNTSDDTNRSTDSDESPGNGAAA
jgi:hypothetical protein